MTVTLIYFEGRATAFRRGASAVFASVLNLHGYVTTSPYFLIGFEKLESSPVESHRLNSFNVKFGGGLIVYAYLRSSGCQHRIRTAFDRV